MQHYELGMKPVTPRDSIEAILNNDTLRVIVHENGEVLLLTAPIKYPEAMALFLLLLGSADLQGLFRSSCLIKEK